MSAQQAILSKPLVLGASLLGLLGTFLVFVGVIVIQSDMSKELQDSSTKFNTNGVYWYYSFIYFVTIFGVIASLATKSLEKHRTILSGFLVLSLSYIPAPTDKSLGDKALKDFTNDALRATGFSQKTTGGSAGGHGTHAAGLIITAISFFVLLLLIGSDCDVDLSKIFPSKSAVAAPAPAPAEQPKEVVVVQG